MKHLNQITYWGLAFVALQATICVRAADIDLTALIHETQKSSRKPGEITLVWWVPEEFWKASFAQSQSLTATQIDEFLKVVRPNTMIVVVDGKVGSFGGVTYKSEAFIRANTRLLDSQGKSYRPRTEDEVDADTKNMLQMMRPILANMLGPMGQNMHFLVFPGKSQSELQIASATQKGEFTVRIADREFKWRLPLDSLLPVRICAGCKQECRGSWSFCPWCGKALTQK